MNAFEDSQRAIFETLFSWKILLLLALVGFVKLATKKKKQSRHVHHANQGSPSKAPYFSAPRTISVDNYHYHRKNKFITDAEREFFTVLVEAVKDQYFVFPQVHLPSIVDEHIKGQNWRGAFRHIDEKSVDFVLCSKEYLNPILAIELDDHSHDRDERKARDIEVERILKEAELPLLRITCQDEYSVEEIRKQVEVALTPRS